MDTDEETAEEYRSEEELAFFNRDVRKLSLMEKMLGKDFEKFFGPVHDNEVY